MPEEVKFDNEELKKLKEIQDSYMGVQNNFGQLKMAMFRLEQQEIELEDKLKNIQENETEFLKKITEKYGEGNLNPETGVFTPNKSE